MTLIRVFDYASNRYIEVVSLFTGRQLPNVRDDDPCWRNSGSLQRIAKQSHKASELVSFAESRGKGMGKAWKAGKMRRRGAPAVALTEAQIAGIKSECLTVKAVTLAGKYRVPLYRVRAIARATRVGAEATL